MKARKFKFSGFHFYIGICFQHSLLINQCYCMTSSNAGCFGTQATLT